MTTDAPASYDALMAAAEAVFDRVAANAEVSTGLRHLAPASVEAMTEAGLWRVLTPQTYGGSELGLRAQVDSVMLMAQADSAAGWVQMVINAHAFLAASFPEQCQDEVFATGPDTRIPGTLAAQGKARWDGDGWRLQGRWQFASGVDHGDWLMMGASAVDAPPGVPRLVHVIVPKADVVVDDTWFTLGLRGTGSKDLVAEDVFVPVHRSVATRLLAEGRSPHGERHATRLYRLPLVAALSLQMASAAVGIAKAALAVHVERTRGRVDVYIAQAKARTAGAQMRVAESTAELTTAELLVRHAADLCDRTAAAGEWMDTAQRVTFKWHAAYAVELARRATERIFASAGAHAIFDESRLQALYRDVNTACHHAIVDFDSSAEYFGRKELGVDVDQIPV